MPRCYLCNGVSSDDTEPCPMDVPCEPEGICGFQVVRCEHKRGIVEVRVRSGQDASYQDTMLLTAYPKLGEIVKATKPYKAYNKNYVWGRYRVTGFEADIWDDDAPPVAVLERLPDIEKVRLARWTMAGEGWRNPSIDVVEAVPDGQAGRLRVVTPVKGGNLRHDLRMTPYGQLSHSTDRWYRATDETVTALDEARKEILREYNAALEAFKARRDAILADLERAHPHLTRDEVEALFPA